MSTIPHEILCNTNTDNTGRSLMDKSHKTICYSINQQFDISVTKT